MRDGWKEISLEDLETSGVIKLGRGDVISKKDMEADPGPNPVYSSAENKNGMIGKYAKFMFDEELITWSVDGGGHIFYRPKHKFSVTNIGGWLRILDDKVFYYQFLTFALQRLHKQHSFDWQHKAHPSVIRKLYTRIPLPSLPEQKRIVDLIASVDSYIEALQQQLESAKRSRSAVLHELLTAGGADWVETTLGEVTQINPEQARDFDSERLIKYVDLSTVTFDNGIDSEIDPIPFNEAPGRARRIVRENDVIVATVRPYLKGFAFVNKDFNEQIASTGFCVIRAESELILPELVWALVGSDDFVDFLIRRSTGSSYPAVRPIDISEFNFMLPPFKDQETVSQLIRTFDQLIKNSTNQINSTQNLRSGLLSDLLSGEHKMPASYDKVIGAA